MSICDNSLLISCNSRIQIRVHFTRFEHCQVSICDNSLANSFIFGFLELSYFFILIVPPSALRPQASGLRLQASCLTTMTMTMMMMIMIMTMTMTMIMIMNGHLVDDV